MADVGGRVEGYTELLVKLKALPAAQQKTLKVAYRKAGQAIADDGSRRIQALDPPSDKTAAGYRVYVRLRGLEVDQTLRKTTGLRPDWGKTQMRYGLVPALEDNRDQVIADVEVAMDAAQEAVGLT